MSPSGLDSASWDSEEEQRGRSSTPPESPPPELQLPAEFHVPDRAAAREAAREAAHVAAKLKLRAKLKECNAALRALKNQHSALLNSGRAEDAALVAVQHEALLPKKRRLLARIRKSKEEPLGDIEISEDSSSDEDSASTSVVVRAAMSPATSISLGSPLSSQPATGSGSGVGGVVTQKHWRVSGAERSASRNGVSQRPGPGKGVARARRATPMQVKQLAQVVARSASAPSTPNAASARGYAAPTREGKDAGAEKSWSQRYAQAQVRVRILDLGGGGAPQSSGPGGSGSSNIPMPGSESPPRTWGAAPRRSPRSGPGIPTPVSPRSRYAVSARSATRLSPRSASASAERRELIAQLERRQRAISNALVSTERERVDIDAQLDASMKAVLAVSRQWRQASVYFLYVPLTFRANPANDLTRSP